MTVILQGVRSDGTPLVLVRCSCGWMDWLVAVLEREREVWCRECQTWWLVNPQKSLAEADVAYPEVQKEQLVA